MTTPEKQSWQEIEKQLALAGWLVQDVSSFDLTTGFGVAIRRFKYSVIYVLCVRQKAIGVISDGYCQYDYSLGLGEEYRRLPRHWFPLPIEYEMGAGGVLRFRNLLEPDCESREVYRLHRPEELMRRVSERLRQLRRREEDYWLWNIGFEGRCLVCGSTTDNPNALGCCSNDCVRERLGEKAEDEVLLAEKWREKHASNLEEDAWRGVGGGSPYFFRRVSQDPPLFTRTPKISREQWRYGCIFGMLATACLLWPLYAIESGDSESWGMATRVSFCIAMIMGVNSAAIGIAMLKVLAERSIFGHALRRCWRRLVGLPVLGRSLDERLLGLLERGLMVDTSPFEVGRAVARQLGFVVRQKEYERTLAWPWLDASERGGWVFVPPLAWDREQRRAFARTLDGCCIAVPLLLAGLLGVGVIICVFAWLADSMVPRIMANIGYWIFVAAIAYVGSMLGLVAISDLVSMRFGRKEPDGMAVEITLVPISILHGLHAALRAFLSKVAFWRSTARRL